jgi:uncharacterized protein YjbI with pentapeptide repeats
MPWSVSSSQLISNAWWSLWHALSQPLDLVLCPEFNWGCRYLNINNRALLGHVWNSEAVARLGAGHASKEAGVEGVILSKRTLRFVHLIDDKLYNADLGDADLRQAILSGSHLEYANLFSAKLQGADLTVAHLSGARLEASNLQGAVLQTASLEGTHFGGAYLIAADLRGAFLDGADLSGNGRWGAELQGTDLSHASLKGADLRGAQLQGANLAGAHLEGADLSGAQLQGTDLTDAELNGAYLHGVFAWRADIRKAHTQGAYIASVETGPEVRVRCPFPAFADEHCNSGDIFDRLKQSFHYIPESRLKSGALERIQKLDPGKPIEGEQDMARAWADLQSMSPASDAYKQGLAAQWRDIGCAISGAPYVFHTIISKLYGQVFFGEVPVILDKRQVHQLASDFLKDDCTGAQVLSKFDRANIAALQNRTADDPSY